jgi:hypothetical protein
LSTHALLRSCWGSWVIPGILDVSRVSGHNDACEDLLFFRGSRFSLFGVKRAQRRKRSGIVVFLAVQKGK